ncbi:MAG: hypothetical protein ACO2PL_19940 [Armatimonadota bacterium]
MGRKNGWLVGLALFLVSPLAFVQAQRILEEQLAGVRLGAPFIDYDEEGRLKPDCLLAIYGMPTYLAGGGAAPAQNGLISFLPSMPAQSSTMPSAPTSPPFPPLEDPYSILFEWINEPYSWAAAKEVAIRRRESLMINDILKNYDAGKISREQAEELIKKIRKESKEEIETIRATARAESMRRERMSDFLRELILIIAIEGRTAEEAMIKMALPEFLRPTKEDIEVIKKVARAASKWREELKRFYGGLMPGEGSKGAAGTTEVAPTFPHPEELAWVIPPFVQLDTNMAYFVYCHHRQGAHLNFLMKLTGTEGRKEFRVVAITVAGRRYDGAQTAKGDPFKSIKLGDDLQRVLLRYGLPDEIVYYNPLTLQVVNTPTRNLILRYHLTRNIEFTILGDKVVRIFIFLPGQVTFNRR